MADNEKTEIKGGQLKIATPKKPSVRERLAQAKEAQATASVGRVLPVSESDGVDLLLDDSSSMRWDSGQDDKTPRYVHLKDAVNAFGRDVNFSITPPICIRPFNAGPQMASSAADFVRWTETYNPSGSTPMGNAIAEMNNHSSKRGLLISDGDADSSPIAIEMAKASAELKKVIDCIHIGPSEEGERTLKQIAEITGGMFLKFKDMAAFEKSLPLLSPRKRNVLASASPKERLRLTGASESQ